MAAAATTGAGGKWGGLVSTFRRAYDFNSIGKINNLKVARTYHMLKQIHTYKFQKDGDRKGLISEVGYCIPLRDH